MTIREKAVCVLDSSANTDIISFTGVDKILLIYLICGGTPHKIENIM